ncbi:MAG: hypothetical protein DWQ05_00740 [Calditrichaeota bacterium]|nr:MAG: hypothetical protein DWQ05_00740 [Calditrichota bacterium]
MELNFEHIHYRCADMHATTQWYIDVLGATFLEEKMLAGNRAIRLELGGTILNFFPADKSLKNIPAMEKLGAYHIAFFVENHDAAVAHFKKRGALFFKEGIMAAPDLKVAFIEAPDGMQVELMEKIQ